MPIDATNDVTQADDWVEATAAAVSTITLFDVVGDAPLLVRFQDTAPALDGDLGHGIKWDPRTPAADLPVPGGIPTRMWVWAGWGTTSYYIKHA